jgi:hypothetical protein
MQRMWVLVTLWYKRYSWSWTTSPKHVKEVKPSMTLRFKWQLLARTEIYSIPQAYKTAQWRETGKSAKSEVRMGHRGRHWKVSKCIYDSWKCTFLVALIYFTTSCNFTYTNHCFGRLRLHIHGNDGAYLPDYVASYYIQYDHNVDNHHSKISKTQGTANVTAGCEVWHRRMAASFEQTFFFPSPKTKILHVVCHIKVSTFTRNCIFLPSLEPTTVYFNRLRAIHSKRAGLLVVAVSIPLQLSQKLEDKINKASQ